MTTALIVAGVIAFIVVDVLVFWRFFGRGNRDAAYGSVAAPGETTLELPAGKVKVTYQESRKAPSRGSAMLPHFPVPEDLDVSLSSSAANRAAVELQRDGRRVMAVPGFFPGGPFSRVTVGHVDIPAAGRYAVNVSGGGAGPRPQVLLGR